MNRGRQVCLVMFFFFPWSISGRTFSLKGHSLLIPLLQIIQTEQKDSGIFLTGGIAIIQNFVKYFKD